MEPECLSPEDKTFFKTVYNAAFANPFGDRRERLDREIAGLFPSARRREITDMCVGAVDQRIRDLEARGRSDCNRYDPEDRTLLRAVCLFDIFHKFRDRFDRLIQDQIAARDTPVRVPFVEEARQVMLARGFTEQEFYHYLALCFQMRRAFYFISKTLIGNSPCMKTLRKNLWNNVFTSNIGFYDQHLWHRMEDFSTLILGETGTGKGTAANAIGRSGFIPFDPARGCFTQSFTRAFSALNLSQFPETLLESELFGHTKGAFTGAVDDHKGVFDRCSPHGAIFLDEIGEIPCHIQIKLLQVLQDRVFTPVGSHTPSRFHGRVIAATNRPRDEIMAGQVFRDDFYYRLCSDIIEVPPLRTRILECPGELDDLLAFTIARMTGAAPDTLIAKIRRAMDTSLGDGYAWPGNVRELEQCVRSVILRRTCSGKSAGIPRDPSPDTRFGRLCDGISRRNISAADLLGGYCTLLYEDLGAYDKVARITGLDRRTVKKYIMTPHASLNR